MRFVSKRFVFRIFVCLFKKFYKFTLKTSKEDRKRKVFLLILSLNILVTKEKTKNKEYLSRLDSIV